MRRIDVFFLILENKQSGRTFVQVKRVQLWQLSHPEGTAEECVDWMRESQAKRAKF